jgi:LmbE family N-acetylglucosaminyl deacetylase
MYVWIGAPEPVFSIRQACRTIRWGVLLLLLCIWSLPCRAQPLTPNAQSMKTDLLVVTAHPDDESMMAATMARYADEGRKVALVVCTRGEGGGNSTGKESGAALGMVREAELRQCLALLGAHSLTFLNQSDWAYTESVQATLKRWGHQETLRRLVRVVRVLKPNVIATMDPAPRGGQHGHHQAAGRLATEAFDAAADPRAFPELLEEEGLSPWRVRKLYWVGGGANSQTLIATDGVAKGVLASTSPGQRYADIARLAESHHRSQGFDKYFGTPSSNTAPARPDRFILVKSRVACDPTGETDLFANTQETVSVSETDILPPSLPSSRPESPVIARLQPGQTVRNYRAWLHANHIERLMTRLSTEIPVTIGASAPVIVEVTNRTSIAQTGQVMLHLPSDWKAKTVKKRFKVAPLTTRHVTFTIQVPADAQVAGYEVKAQIEGAVETDRGKLNARPHLRVSRLRRSLPVNADLKKWERAGIPSVPIPSTNVAQGSPASASEISGRFFVGYDAWGIQVLVAVTDDTVVNNIAPDDIKAHWRTTSVEICLDPTPRAENTFGTLKLGIFPADTTGRVRAARDADANPGAVDKKEPGIRLASRRTGEGYIVETRIPWKALRASVSFSPAKGSPLGFNIILYHAGKKEARVGEDVNKSRLAWSFWSGVWGRPEMWGTAVLD